LTRREVVAPLSSEVVRTEQGLTTAGVNLDQVRIEQKKVLNAYQQVKLAIETEALQRCYAIDDLRRRIRVIEARLAYVGQLHADRDGEVLDLQVIAGQTVAVVQRLGTIGRVAGGGASLKAVSYFAPADARRLRNGMPVEVAPQWNQRSRFGGIVGKVLQVNTLPATEEDISTTIGNPQTGTGSLCTVRPATDGGEPEGRREPWREQRRTPEGSAPQVKGSPPPRSAHQRRTSKGGEPGPEPWRGADHGGACGSGAHSELSESGGLEHPARLPSDTSDRRSSGMASSRSLPEKSPRVIPWNHPWGEGPCMPSASAD
jgi:hypothetical protein